MHEIKNETINNTYRPFDVVKLINGDVAYINEVGVNSCQPSPEHQIKYSICVISGETSKTAWYRHDELEYQCNLFVKIAEGSCNSFSSGRNWVEKMVRPKNVI